MALSALLALALASFSSADPLGEITLCEGGLRESAFIRQLTPGPDGNVWFVDNEAFSEGSAIGRVTPSCEIKEFFAGEERDVVAIVAGPKGEKYLWFTDKGATPAIGRIDSKNPETPEAFPIQGKGGNAGSVPEGIAVGPEGNLWFADAGVNPAIGVFNPETEVVKECSVGLSAGSEPHGIVAGPDGNLWFTDGGTTRAIGKVNPSTCEIKEFATGANSEPGGTNSPVGPWGIAAGPDGNVWFTENGISTTEGRSATGKAIGRITPSGEITYFSEGLSSSSGPFGLTAAGGKLWFADDSFVNEQQEIELKATENLGGTYKLCFEGKCTGWIGIGDTTAGWAGTGDVVRYPVSGTLNCTRTIGSQELKSCGAELLEKAEVGMRIICTGLPAKTLIEKVEGNTIFISKAASTSGVNSCAEGWIKNVSTTAGELKVGQLLTSSSGSPSNSAIIACTPNCTSPTAITTEAVPTAAGIKTGAILEVGSKTVSNVTASTGTPSKGETISGEGIQAGTTITNCSPSCESATSLTLSKVTVKAGTGVSLSADLGFAATTSAIQAALEALPPIGKNKFEIPNISVSGAGNVSPVKRVATFEGELGAKDVPQLTCDASGLTGVNPSCSVTTTATGKPNAIGSITTSGAITRYEKEELLWGVSAITNGPDGNLWCTSGLTVIQSICKFGIGPVSQTLKVECVGPGSGSVKPVDCGSSASFVNGTEVALEASAGKNSAFAGWSGCTKEESGKCIVKLSGFDEITVTATFIKADIRALAITKNANGPGGTGTVSSKPRGIKCSASCTEAVASFPPGISVELTAKPSTGSAFVKWENAEEGGACDGSASPICTAPAQSFGGEEVEAVFSGTSKTITPIEALTLSKGESSGKGTVKAYGSLACESECTSTTVLYQGPITEPKPIPGKTVVLKQYPAFGSEFSGWEGCDSETEEGYCVVTMETDRTITAEYDVLPNVDLTIEKSAYENGAGSVISKPKGIGCGAYCTRAVAAMPEGASIELKAKPNLENIFVEWQGGDCDEGKSLTCTVTMDEAEEVVAVFKGPVKKIEPAETLTLTKAGTGFGTVKAAGLACEVLCTSVSALFQGPIVEKGKPGKTVILRGAPAPGSKAVEWSGCDSIDGEGNCVVTMESSREVTATFAELE